MVRPHLGEQVHDYEREDKGKSARGEVVRNEYELEECIVRYSIYKANPIIGACGLLACNGDVFWDARDLNAFNEKYPFPRKWSYVGVPTVSSELVSYSWDDLSYDRGLQCWIMET